jgi:hypothetical protein
LPATECPRISGEFLKEEREALGPWWYEQEYKCKFKENVDSVFSSALIACKKHYTNFALPRTFGQRQ